MVHVLVASRSFQLRASLEQELSDHGFEVTIARDGNEAIALAEMKQPDFLVTSMELDFRSSFLVLEHLAHRLDYPLPAIVLGHPGRYGKRHQQWLNMLGATVVESSTTPVAIRQMLARWIQQEPEPVRPAAKTLAMIPAEPVVG